MPSGVKNPEKELRFTRAGQALPFWLIAAVGFGAGIIIILCGFYRHINPALPHPLWAVLPAVLAVLSLKLALHLTRHAYLILTPLGVEIFPFLRPAAGMRLIVWQEIAAADVDEDETRLTLHYTADKSAGIHLSLRPIPKERRTLLAKAVAGRLSRQSAPDPS